MKILEEILDNPDSAVGGFQSNNIEMQEINNANNENTGGNFGLKCRK